MKIYIAIEKHRPLVIELLENPVTEKYVRVLSRNLSRNGFVFRDPVKYTIEYFQKLCSQVKNQLGWDWIKDEYSIDQTIAMHKHIESTLERSESFKNIPGDLQNLIFEAHFCIHQIQYKNNSRIPAIQIEWFNDDHESLPLAAEFILPDFGDLILQNPYVGHPPIQCWQQNDFKNIFRTCQFVDKIKPGITINTMPKHPPFDIADYKKWWMENCGDYVDSVGWGKIKYYTGFCKIGEVIDKDNLREIVEDHKPLNITKIELL